LPALAASCQIARKLGVNMSASEALSALPQSPAAAKPYRPDWLQKPSGEDMSAFYPRRAERHDINGRATIKCQVDAGGGLVNCKVMAEAPRGEGFGAAAVSLSRKFRMTPPQGHVGPQPPEITIPIVFQIPDYNRKLPKAKAAGSAADGGSFESLIAKASAAAPMMLGAMVVVVIVLLLVLNQIRANSQGRDL
jgi:TonB family protein